MDGSHSLSFAPLLAKLRLSETASCLLSQVPRAFCGPQRLHWGHLHALQASAKAGKTRRLSSVRKGAPLNTGFLAGSSGLPEGSRQQQLSSLRTGPSSSAPQTTRRSEELWRNCRPAGTTSLQSEPRETMMGVPGRLGPGRFQQSASNPAACHQSPRPARGRWVGEAGRG